MPFDENPSRDLREIHVPGNATEGLPLSAVCQSADVDLRAASAFRLDAFVEDLDVDLRAAYVVAYLEDHLLVFLAVAHAFLPGDVASLAVAHLVLLVVFDVGLVLDALVVGNPAGGRDQVVLDDFWDLGALVDREAAGVVDLGSVLPILLFVVPCIVLSVGVNHKCSILCSLHTITLKYILPVTAQMH